MTDEGGKISAMVGKLRHSTIDSSIIEVARGDVTPGTSVIVLLSSTPPPTPWPRRSTD